MDRLAGPNIHIVLTVKEGRGFDSVGHHPILVEASLENNHLDTSLPPPGDQSQFGIEFVWETTKQAVRRLRTAKVPVRVDCYSILNQEKRKKIGFCLLNLAGASVVPKGQYISDNLGTWYKLICENVETRAPRPEIRLVMLITDECRHPEEPLFLNKTELPVVKNFESDLQNSTKTVQIGPELVGKDAFLLEIMSSNVYNIDWFPFNDMSKPTSEAYLLFTIFSTSSRSGPIGATGEKSKTTITLHSTKLLLQQHLTKYPFMEVQLMVDNSELAMGEMNLSHLIPMESVTPDVGKSSHRSESSVCTSSVYLTPKNYPGVLPTTDTTLPYVELIVNLQCHQATGEKMDDLEENLKQVKNCGPKHNPGYKVLQAAGEMYPLKESISHLMSLPLTTRFCGRKPASTSLIPSPRLAKTMNSHSEPKLQIPASKECLSSFSLDVSVENIVFHKLPAQKNFFFKFHHPKADVLPTSLQEIFVKEADKMVCLENIKCKFKFTASPEEICRLLITCPPYLSICTISNSQMVQLAVATLDTGRLLVEKKSSTFAIPLVDTFVGEKVGAVYLSMSLEEIELHHYEDGAPIQTVSEEILSPQDNAAYNIVEELHMWKEKQQEMFNAELFAKEKHHLNILTTEFKKKRDSLQARLEKDLLQCQLVIQTLQASMEENRATSRKQAEMEAELKLRQEEMDRKYKMKFQDLREASRRMEDDLQHRMKLVEMEKEELVVKAERLKKENESLKQTILDQEVDREICQKGSLSKEQIATLLQETKLLQEKLKEANESKTLFKEQWACAVREIHKIKCDHQEAIQIQIRDFKEELKTLGFQRFLNEEESELKEDQQTLHQMKSELSEINSFSDYSKKLKEMFPENYQSSDMNERMGCQPVKLSENSELSAKKSIEGKEKLQQLIRERDALLRTGSYSMDDQLIVKINQEIRTYIEHYS